MSEDAWDFLFLSMVRYRKSRITIKMLSLRVEMEVLGIIIDPL